jgi:NADH dehydrogenase (ubiquinone) Fe-S protein 8
MASTKALTLLAARSRPAMYSTSLRCPARTLPGATANLTTSAARGATPTGPPPSGFRLPRKERWDEGKESSLDKAGNYFLLTEMFRGMYVVLEQFFRPP